LLRPLRRLLWPLVRLAIISGITFPVLADLLRGLFVEVALRDLLRDPAARTDSRISLLTGVHRKEIRRLRLEAPMDDAIPDVVTISSQIIGHWLGAPAYTDAAGYPKPLPRTAQGADPSFEALVQMVTTDIRPRAVLDDFIAQGLVTLTGDQVQLNQAAFIPRQGREEQLFFFARNLHDHIAAAAANITNPTGPEFLDSSVHYDRLDPATAAQLLATAQSTAEQALLQVNRAAIGLVSPADAAPTSTPTRRVNFGIYIYVEDETGPETEA
jgi:hypothetical protein